MQEDVFEDITNANKFIFSAWVLFTISIIIILLYFGIIGLALSKFLINLIIFLLLLFNVGISFQILVLNHVAGLKISMYNYLFAGCVSSIIPIVIMWLFTFTSLSTKLYLSFIFILLANQLINYYVVYALINYALKRHYK